MRPLLLLAGTGILALGWQRPALALDAAPLRGCVQPFYQNQLSAEAAFHRCLEALHTTAGPDKYWLQDRALARWRIKAGRVVWLSLQSVLDKGGDKPKEDEFAWFVDELKAIADSKALGGKYTSRAYIVVGGIKGVITKYYRFGLSKKGIGKESFSAVRNATFVDPYKKEFWNLEAWMTYGRALVEVCNSSTPKMAAYVLDIDRKIEVARTVDALDKMNDIPGLSSQNLESLKRVLANLREVEKAL